MKRQQPERQLQKAVADFLRHALPPGAFFSALPGGDRQMTLTPGYRSGLPDLIVVYRGQPVFIELKSDAGRLSPTQRLVHADLDKAGACHEVCRSLEDVAATLSVFGIPLRATVGKVAA